MAVCRPVRIEREKGQGQGVIVPACRAEPGIIATISVEMEIDACFAQ